MTYRWINPSTVDIDCFHQVRKTDVSLTGLSRHNSERASHNLQTVLSSGPTAPSTAIGSADEANITSSTTSLGPVPHAGSPSPHSNGSSMTGASHPHGHLSRCTTYPVPLQSGEPASCQPVTEPKLKGILKKSSSSQDVSSAGGTTIAGQDGYVSGYNNNSSRLLLDVAPLASTSDISSNNSSIAEDVASNS